MQIAKNPGGRPPIDPETRLDCFLNLRVTTGFKEKLARAKAADPLNSGQLLARLRKTLDREVDRYLKRYEN